MCFLTVDPKPRKRSSRSDQSKHRPDYSPPKPVLPVHEPPQLSPSCRLPTYDPTYLIDGHVPQSRTQTHNHRGKEESLTPRLCTCQKPLACHHIRRRCSTASSISVRSFQQVKRKLGEIYRRQEREAKFQEKTRQKEMGEFLQRERSERIRDRQEFERLRRDYEKGRERAQIQEYIRDQVHDRDGARRRSEVSGRGRWVYRDPGYGF